jgi:hypothetical protein
MSIRTLMLQSQIKFRFKAFGWHLLASAIVLAVVVGGLYLGWYRWPGWYLADATQVTRVMIGVDLVVGPLLTMVIASPLKPLRTLARDVSVIAAIQLIALGYGSVSLWNGRPLYFAFSEDVLQLVQAYDISPIQAALGRKDNPDLASHWYSLPRWVWAPLPPDGPERDRIISAAVAGGDDVIALPAHYKPWNQGTEALRAQLKRLDDIKYFSAYDKNTLKQRMLEAGLPADQPDCIAMTGRGYPLLAVLNPRDLSVVALLRSH